MQKYPYHLVPQWVIFLVVITMVFSQNQCAVKKKEQMKQQQNKFEFARKLPKFSNEQKKIIGDVLNKCNANVFMESWNYYLSDIQISHDTIVLRYEQLYKLTELKTINGVKIDYLPTFDETSYYELYFDSTYELFDIRTGDPQIQFTKRKQ